MTFVFTEKHVLTHYVSYSSKICVSTFPKTNVSDSGPRLAVCGYCVVLALLLCLYIHLLIVERMDNERLLKKVMNAKVDGRMLEGSLGWGGWRE